MVGMRHRVVRVCQRQQRLVCDNCGDADMLKLDIPDDTLLDNWNLKVLCYFS